ncbi:hypothetical protein SDC9_21705 [bioreactor metagenome]|uniref:Uncharacterized protein n=1 Tax=bioreactor metagenome TaxID=1076179 RepID=A0A644UA63_9ZZZZ
MKLKTNFLGTFGIRLVVVIVLMAIIGVFAVLGKALM